MSKIEKLTEAIQELTRVLSQKPKLEDVRAALAEIAKQGKTQEMKELLSKYGAAKLSEVKPENYAPLLADAEELKNA